MENNTQNADTLILDRKLGHFGKNEDFVAPKELTVTITLAEYRSLVSTNAKSSSEYEKLQREKWALESENKKLKETIEALKLICPRELCTEPTDTKQTED